MILATRTPSENIPGCNVPGDPKPYILGEVFQTILPTDRDIIETDMTVLSISYRGLWEAWIYLTVLVLPGLGSAASQVISVLLILNRLKLTLGEIPVLWCVHFIARKSPVPI